MQLEFKLPKLADTADNYVVVEWKVAVGDTVRAAEPLVVIETDKTEVELDVPADGTVVALRAAEGDEVTTGQVICVMETEQ
jgi:pyruvate/2-oxoglutarate dehydrogenase complex dihydrolipoamide acyltransferase (E2) component